MPNPNQSLKEWITLQHVPANLQDKVVELFTLSEKWNKSIIFSGGECADELEAILEGDPDAKS